MLHEFSSQPEMILQPAAGFRIKRGEGQACNDGFIIAQNCLLTRKASHSFSVPIRQKNTDLSFLAAIVYSFVATTYSLVAFLAFTAGGYYDKFVK
ncbi:hypothetical protein [Clostridium sp. KNHs216]|uniref:hypothetical protein n=1 Tax=Clostridium sp. KNHs216 TaxID=1550235 RepID=UPI00114FB8AF|nr:hypothetical protein [Clostridium sp. KNHs216]